MRYNEIELLYKETGLNLFYFGLKNTCVHIKRGRKGGTMKREDIYFDSRDNETKIHAIRWTPEGVTPVCVVQIVHGMAEHIERYEEFARFLTERGYVVTGDNHLGHGKSISQDGQKGYFCKQDPATVLVRDVHRLKKMTQEAFPGIPYYILGHSMGSFITRNYLTMYGTGIDGAIIMGTGMKARPMLMLSKAVLAVQKLFLGEKHYGKFFDKLAFGTNNQRISNPKTPFDWLTKEETEVQKYIDDPDCGFIFTLNGYRTLMELIDRCYDKKLLKKIPVKLPILVISGLMDPVGGYGKEVEKTIESLKNAGLQKIEAKLYEQGRHELLNETERDTVMEDVYQFIERSRK